MIRRFGTLASVLALSACATVGMSASYVAPLSNQNDAPVLAGGIVSVLNKELPAGRVYVAFDHPEGSDDVRIALNEAMHKGGLLIAPPGQTGQNVHQVHYWITPLDNGDLERVQIDGKTLASVVFDRSTAGGLIMRHPFTVLASEVYGG